MESLLIAQLIQFNAVSFSYDRCYANGNWTTSYSECGEWSTTSAYDVIYEFNLPREPLSVTFGEHNSLDSEMTLKSFP